MNKQQSAEDTAAYIREAISSITKAITIMEQNGLNLENYPEYWHDFAEHPSELANMAITDFENVQVLIQV